MRRGQNTSNENHAETNAREVDLSKSVNAACVMVNKLFEGLDIQLREMRTAKNILDTSVHSVEIALEKLAKNEQR